MSNGKRFGPKRYHITFEAGHEYEDLELTVRRISFGAMLKLSSAAEQVQAVNVLAGQLAPGQAEAIASMCAQLASVILGWNVDDEDGNPVTPDEAGLMAQDPFLVMACFQAYADQVLAVPPPLPGPPPGGGTPPENPPAEEEESLGLASSSVSLPG